MKLTKAKEILQLHLANATIHKGQDTYVAIQLGIEALKQVVDNRVGPRVIVFKPLPGETKE